MGKSNTILIAERNPNIRRFLGRELSACGYHVFNVENAKELLELIYSHEVEARMPAALVPAPPQ